MIAELDFDDGWTIQQFLVDSRGAWVRYADISAEPLAGWLLLQHEDGRRKVCAAIAVDGEVVPADIYGEVERVDLAAA